MQALRAIPLTSIAVDDPYWNKYVRLIPQAVIPYQWEILNDRVPEAPPSHCINNYRIAAGEAVGQRKGTVFLDSDLTKWLEAVAYSLAAKKDPELERTADDAIALIGRAQCGDGYLNTYYTLVEPEGRWNNLTEGHELYCAGHLIEAAVAYHQATGKAALLSIACRFADLICETFGPEEGQIHGYPGHPEIELALVRLFQATGQEKYLQLAKFFVDARGTAPNYFLQEMAQPDFRHLFADFRGYSPEYAQAHKPVREQSTAEGHAVRAVYLYCAMVDLAVHFDDGALLAQCCILWENIVNKRMFLTGGIGSSGVLERFTTDYDLPNDSNYAETCASIGLALFGLRLARATGEAAYFDVVERALYNTVRAGISLEGDRYFYVNPLEVWPSSCMENTSREHVKPVRQTWFDVACCPTNIARTLTALGQYIFSRSDRELYVNLYVQSRAEMAIDGHSLEISQKNRCPRTGDAAITVVAENLCFALKLRVPEYAESFRVEVNGSPASGRMDKGYFVIERQWNRDVVEVSFSLRPQIVHANPAVRANSGKVAVVRGPEVYCLEEMDNGPNLSAVYLNDGADITEEWRDDLLGGAMVLHCRGRKLVAPDLAASFSAQIKPGVEDVDLTFVPYGSWGNRAPGEMIVWLHSTPGHTKMG